MKRLTGILTFSTYLICSPVFADFEKQSTKKTPISSYHERNNKLSIHVFDDKYNPLTVSKDQGDNSISYTIDDNDFWVSEGENPDNNKPSCSAEFVGTSTQNITTLTVYCNWQCGRTHHSENLEKFRSYLKEFLSNTVTTSQGDNSVMSMPKNHMNLGWFGNLDIQLYNPDMCKTVGEPMHIQTYHLKHVLGQSKHSGWGTLAKQLFSTGDKVMECVEEDGECPYSLVKDFSTIEHDIENLERNLWTIGVNASKGELASQNGDDEDLHKFAAKTVTSMLKPSSGSSDSNQAVIGYFQDDNGIYNTDLEYTIKQSGNEKDDEIDLVLSSTVMSRLVDQTLQKRTCTSEDVTNAQSHHKKK